MNLPSKLSGIFRPESAGLVCPRCDRELEGHDEERCDRMASRRYFLQTVIGAAVAAPLLPNVHIGVDMASGANLPGNFILTPEMIAGDVLPILKYKLAFARSVNQSFTVGSKIGATINVRRPYRYSNGLSLAAIVNLKP